jgi:hypothetical protein
MFPNGPNPSKLQPAPPCLPRKTPLILIHDGGGTVFGYFFLGSLGREVWALHDPHYWESEPWEGGIDEQAETYLDMMRKAGIQGDVYLGGKLHNGSGRLEQHTKALRLVLGRPSLQGAGRSACKKKLRNGRAQLCY